MQVPDALIAVCCSVAQQDPMSTAACMAFTALEALFDKATEPGGPCGPTPDSTRMGPSSSRVGSSSTGRSSTAGSSSSVQDLAPFIRSQVLQSGLMNALSTVMTAAAAACLQVGSFQQPLPPL